MKKKLEGEEIATNGNTTFNIILIGVVIVILDIIFLAWRCHRGEIKFKESVYLDEDERDSPKRMWSEK